MANHCDTMPPQASIAFKTRVRDDTRSTSDLSPGPPSDTGLATASISGPPAGSLGAEQQLACFFAAQQEEATAV